MSEWIEHDGRSVPEIDGLRCDLRLRNGFLLKEENSYDLWNHWLWADRAPSPDDIVAYRVMR